MNLQAKLTVLFVWFIIIFEFSCYVFLYIPLLFQHNFIFCAIILPIFIFIYTLLCISYYKSIFSTPGYTNLHAVSNPEFQNIHYNDQIDDIKARSRAQNQKKKLWRTNRKKGQINLQEINSLNAVGFCFKCDLVKQPRTHHCKICKRCIMRMDHHCPWVGNCVGKLNHKYFILFLLYATTDLLVVAITPTLDWMIGGSFYALQLTEYYRYVYYFSCVSSWMLALSIGFLFVTQMITSLKNITTLQSFTQGINQKNIFDRFDWKQNLRQIFGSGNWFLPTNPFPTDSPLINGSLDVL